MRHTLLTMLAVGILSGSVVGVTLPEKWERLTCKVTTEGMIGTGFLLRYADKIFIVTSKHVVTRGKSEFYVGLNPEVVLDTVKGADPEKADSGGSSEPRIIPSEKMYFTDPDYDIAFVHITEYASLLDITAIPESVIGDDSMIVAGREVFFLGYPRGMAGYNAKVPLVRGGIIAGDFRHKIILDGNFFGGSSGSPVFLNIDRQNNVLSWYLIGIVAEMRTAPTRTDATMEENMGIGIAIKISYIRSAIENWLSEQE